MGQICAIKFPEKIVTLGEVSLATILASEQMHIDNLDKQICCLWLFSLITNATSV